MSLPFFAALVLHGFLLCAPAGAQEPTASGRPAYQFLRQNEDWAGFVRAVPVDDFVDPIKHVSLSDDGRVWVGFGGRIESRLEVWRGFAFGPPPGGFADDAFVLTRALVHADLHAGDHLRVFVEGKTAQATERDLPGGRRTLDMDTLDLQQAFLDVVVPMGDSTLTVRPGRQMLLFGAQRLISPLPWGNALRTWQGVSAEWRQGAWSVNALATAFVPVDKTDFNEADEDQALYGLYARRSPPAAGHGLELYALGSERPDVTVNGTTGDETRQTFGTRLWGPLAERVDYEIEGGWQIGDIGDADVNAWFLASQAGWKLENVLGGPRLWLGLDLASGDEAVGGNVETFHQLFPLGHAYFGYIDAVGRQNIIDASTGANWQLASATRLQVGLHAFRLMETSDALYNAGGVPYRSGFDSSDVGAEIDVRIDRRIDRHAEAYVGYSHFFPGGAIEETGPAEEIDFLYFGVQYTF